MNGYITQVQYHPFLEDLDEVVNDYDVTIGEAFLNGIDNSQIGNTFQIY